MRIFVIGAAGYVGAAIVRGASAEGHELAGFARDSNRVEELRAAGLIAFEGDLTSPESLTAAFEWADGVIYTASVPADQEAVIVRGLVEKLENTGKALVFVSGAFLVAKPAPNGEWRDESFREDDAFLPPRRSITRTGTELLVRTMQGGRGMVVRPPLIWGFGASMQLPAYFEGALKAGAACYVGAGLNAFSTAHVDEVADVARLALDRGTSGGLYHVVSGEVNFLTVADAVSKVLQIPTRSITLDEASSVWDPIMGPVMFGHSCRIQAPRARADLGWAPRGYDLITDIVEGSYKEKYGGRVSLPA